MLARLTTEAKILIIISAISVVLLIGGVFFLNHNSAKVEDQAVVEASKLIKADSYQTATDSAKVKATVVEFADFQCPACAAFHPVMTELRSTYPETVNVVFRHFPLPQHQNAMAAARAAESAGAQNKFWQMYDLLYQKQSEWQGLANPKDKFVEYAVSIGVNRDQFSNDYDSGKFDSKINGDYAEGSSFGVNSTPTVYFNNQKLPTPTFGELKGRIDPLL